MLKKKWTKGIIKALSFPPDTADNYNDTDKFFLEAVFFTSFDIT